VQMFSQAGKVGPAYCTGVGKVMLAYTEDAQLTRLIGQQSFHQFTSKTFTTAETLMEELDGIVARGYGFDDEEHEPGIICVAVPILTEKGRPLGALSVTSTTDRQTLKGMETFAPLLQQTARDIAYDAANWHIRDEDS
jgi:IclR family KDG regulon transcriptional repressor